MIPVKNVYYMLSYAFRILQEKGYASIKIEEFNNTAELFAAILCKGVSNQLKRGLRREYILTTESLSMPRGKIEISESLTEISRMQQRLVCTHDEFSENAYMNRILKTVMLRLLRFDVKAERKKELRKILDYFDDVEPLDIHTINWRFQYNRNNQSYRMLMGICYLAVKGLLQTQEGGSSKMMDFLDDQKMHRLYERFILEYYRTEFKGVLRAESSEVKWALDDDFDELLPGMQSDIMLTAGDKTLIIDAKYYSHSLVSQYEKESVRSSHLYQIFTYVKNKEAALANTPHQKVAGMLLYAQTEEEGSFDKTYQMSGNPITVKTLDLNADFAEIRRHLDEIAKRVLNVERMIA